MQPCARHLIALLSSLLLGCASFRSSTPPGDGPADLLSAKTIDVPAFSSVVAQCTCYVDIKVGPTHGVVVRARKELLPGIAAEVEDGTLRLQYLPTDVRFARDPVRFEVSLPELHAVDAKLVTAATVQVVSGEQLRVFADGASQIEVEGDVQRLHAELHNQAKLDARALRATDVHITIDGSGEADVNAQELLRASAYRFGKVWYHGEPKVLDVDHGRRRVRPG